MNQNTSLKPGFYKTPFLAWWDRAALHSHSKRRVLEGHIIQAWPAGKKPRALGIVHNNPHVTVAWHRWYWPSSGESCSSNPSSSVQTTLPLSRLQIKSQRHFFEAPLVENTFCLLYILTGASACVWKSELVLSFQSSTWILRIKLRQSYLVASTFTYYTVSSVLDSMNCPF